MTTNNSAEKGKTPVKRMSRAANVIVFIGSFLGAFLLWIYAIGYDSTLFESTFNGIEVTIEGEEKLTSLKGFTLAEGQNFSSITVVAKGKRADLNALDASDFRAIVDVSQADSAGEQTLKITVQSPNGIEVVSQSSTTVSIFLDEFTQYSEPLTVDINTGEYRFGAGVVDVYKNVNPIAVTVSGPKSVLETIDGAFVDFDLGGNEVTNDLRGYGAIQLRDKNGNVINNPYVTVSDSTAEVTITVQKQKSIPVKVMFTGGKFSPSEDGTDDIPYVKSHDSITVTGWSDKISAVSELVLPIDETALEPGETTELKFPINTMLPDGVSSEGGYITVTVTMPDLTVRTHTVSPESITVENLPDGYVYEISKGIKIKIIGSISAIENIDTSLITATVDFNKVVDITDDAETDGESADIVRKYSGKAKISLGTDDPMVYVQNIEYTVEFTVTFVVVPEVVDNPVL